MYSSQHVWYVKDRNHTRVQREEACSSSQEKRKTCHEASRDIISCNACACTSPLRYLRATSDHCRIRTQSVRVVISYGDYRRLRCHTIAGDSSERCSALSLITQQAARSLLNLLKKHSSDVVPAPITPHQESHVPRAHSCSIVRPRFTLLSPPTHCLAPERAVYEQTKRRKNKRKMTANSRHALTFLNENTVY